MTVRVYYKSANIPRGCGVWNLGIPGSSVTRPNDAPPLVRPPLPPLHNERDKIECASSVRWHIELEAMIYSASTESHGEIEARRNFD